jgi:hypothetical protein
MKIRQMGKKREGAKKERKKVRKGIDKGVRRWYSIKAVAKVTARKQESLVEKN